MKIIKEFKERNYLDRQLVETSYLNKYFNLFMNSLEWEGLDNEQIDFLMRKLWLNGTIGAYVVEGTKSEEYPNGLLILASYSPMEYNIYDNPIKVTLINNRGVQFIPSRPLVVNKDVVIGYAQRNKKGIRDLVNFYIQKIVNIEMTIQINLLAQKCPWILGTTPENQNKMQEFWNNLLSDNPKLFASIEDVEKAKALVSGAPYTIDKLYNYKIAVENELREYLGLGNLGVSEKKEHLITEEIKSNDEITTRYSECILNPLQEFCARVNDYLGIQINVKLNKPDSEEYEDSQNEEVVEDEE